MKLEVGKSYRNRKGEIVKIVEEVVGNEYPFKGSKGRIYAENGNYWVGLEARRSDYDLIEEVIKITDGTNVLSDSKTTLTLTLPSGTESFTGQIKGELGHVFDVTLKRRE